MADLEARLQGAVGDAYRIERELGGGGMSRVFVAVETALDRRIVIKVLPPDVAAELNSERFRREIQLVARLQHPHIVPLLTTGSGDGLRYYMMPFIEGESLRARLAREGELEIADTVRILRDVADALAYAHAHGIVHRDIKPDNVLVSDRHGVVTDFGVSKAVSSATEDATLTATGVVLGTPAYMAPEQAAGDPAADHRADIYSFGALGYELLTGHPPFEGRSAQQLLSAHALNVPVSVTARRTGVPHELAELVMRCLEKQAENRPQSASEVQQMLEGMSAHGAAMEPGGSRRRSMSGRAVLGIGVATLGLIAVGAVVGYRGYHGSGLDEHRVIIAPLVNKTGDASLDQVGSLAADWITRGLGETGIVDVATFAPTGDASGRIPEDELAPDALRAQARALSAGRVVSGAYYSAGDSLQFHAQITDAASGDLLESIAPSTAPTSNPMFGINLISVRVMGALAQLSGSEWRIVGSADSPPSYEAFKNFVRGEDAFAVGDFQTAQAYFEHAVALDSTYLVPLVRLVYVFFNIDQLAKADSLGRVLNARRQHLSAYQGLFLDRVRGWCAGDFNASYIASQQMTRLAPRSTYAQYAHARDAFRINRPREAVAGLERLDWKKSHRPGYYDDLADALHKLGNYDRELEVADLYRDRYVGSLQPLDSYVRALSALGRTDDVRRIVTETLASPRGVAGSAGDVMQIAALELMAHGHVEEGKTVARMLVTWLGTRSLGGPDPRPGEPAGLTWGWIGPSPPRLSRALMLAERYAEARVVAQRAIRDDPHDFFELGYEGVSAAAMGDRAAAERAAETLGSLDVPYMTGWNVYWQAAIAARLGKREQAVALLREAVGAGANWALVFDSAPEFLSLRGFAPYDELVRPKG